MTTKIDVFLGHIKILLPQISCDIDSPTTPSGDYWLDLNLDTFSTTVLFKHNYGFGIYTGVAAFGEKPSERYSDPRKTALRIEQLYQTFYQSDTAATGLCLHELRQLHNKTQSEIAAGLGVRQPSIARLEKRDDMKLSTLRDLISSLGGRLETRVIFEDMEAPLSVGLAATHVNAVKISLLVLRAMDPDRLAEFYSCLGLTFKDEKHGKGPAHKACNLYGSVFEIYPCIDKHPPTTGTRIGFTVSCIDESISRFSENLREGLQIVSKKKATEFGTRIVLRDPEGHNVELLERPDIQPSQRIAPNW